jgi:glycosyltransferase 2 family protein
VKKFLVTSLKLGISLAIIAWLVYDAAGTTDEATGQNVFERLKNQPKDWGFLSAAAVLCGGAVVLTLVRWWYLVRALDMPLRFAQAMRIGFLGYLFNLAPMGIVGGDLLKAWMLARQQGGQRTKAFATVIVDRLIGLYVLFVVASAAILLTGFWRLPQPNMRWISLATFAVTALGALAIGVALSPAVTEGRTARALSRLPRLGAVVENAIDAVRTYRGKPGVLLGSSLMSVFVHGLFATGIYCIARGLPGGDLSLPMHWVVAPLAASTGVIPLVMGPLELVLEYLYTHVPAPVTIVAGQGLVVALGYRLITVLIAAVGACYYLGSREELAEVIHEAERKSPPPAPPGTQFAESLKA